MAKRDEKLYAPLRVEVRRYGAHQTRARLVDAQGCTLIWGGCGKRNVKVLEKIVSIVNSAHNNKKDGDGL